MPGPVKDLVDVIVVGAGAAGLMAATEAAARGRRVVLLEKNARAGLKILISGGGRCNLTTTLSGSALEAQYGKRRGRWLRHALRSFPPTALVRLVESLGVPLQEEDLDKIFPVSGRARDVLDALLRRATDCGVGLVFEAPMLAVRWSTERLEFEVETARGTWRSSAIVLATGGLSYPRTGATGDGYPVVQQFGHSVVPTVPALAPLWVELDWVRGLRGIVIDADLALRDATRSIVVRRRRPTLFTHKGLSGPAPMDVSGFVEERGGADCVLELDLAPDARLEQVDAALRSGVAGDGRRRVGQALPRSIPERLRAELVSRTGVDSSAQIASLRRDQRRALVQSVKALRIPVERSLGFKAAEVTRGGVTLDEVDGRTMESKLRPGLFLCGELLDVDGPIGGFNFQAAFGTGRLAGRHA